MAKDNASPWTARRVLWLVALAIILRFGLATVFPVTGDEAYFVLWGHHPALGYYDHPPMIGWWLAILLLLGDHPLLIRTPALLVSLLPGLLLYLLFRREDPDKARLLGLLGLFLPLFTIGLISSTDTPTILFSMLSIYALHRALGAESRAGYVLAGVLLGLALLSKYLAGLLAIAYAAYFLIWDRRRWPVLLFLVLGSLPLFLINLYWNWNHCGYNLVFNFVSRPGDGGFDALNVGTYVLILVYFYTPWLLWFAFRRRDAIGQCLVAHPYRLWAVAGLVPLGLLLVLSPFKGPGLHWIAPFAALPMVLAIALPRAELQRSIRWAVLFALIQTGFFSALALTPAAWLGESPRYSSVVVNLEARDVAQAVFALDPDAPFMTRSYSQSALMGRYGDRHVGVFGYGSHYGRQDDQITDFRRLNGQTIYILERRATRSTEEYTAFFSEVVPHLVQVRGADFLVIEGRGFDYDSYRNIVIDEVLRRHYDPPAWLPIRHCEFTARYGQI